MHQVVIELSYADYVLVAVDAGFLVEVIRLGLWCIYTSWICCHLRRVWIVAIRCFVARFIQLLTNYIVVSQVLLRMNFWKFYAIFCIRCLQSVLYVRENSKPRFELGLLDTGCETCTQTYHKVSRV